MKYFSLTLLAALAASTAGAASDRIAVDLVAPGVRVQTGQGGSSVAVNAAGSIEPGADIEGVSVINGEVFIDGEKVPKGKSTHKGRKSGKVYRIEWGADGNVAIQQK